MDIKIINGAYALATILLEKGDVFYTQPGSMVAMSMGLSYEPRIDDGIISAALRNILGSESFFYSRSISQISGSWLSVAPKYPGDITYAALKAGESLTLQAGSYLGHSKGVDIDIKIAKPGEFLLREGAIQLKITGDGSLLLCSYGQMHQYFLEVGQSLIVDTGHIVCWSSALDLEVGALNNVIGAQFSGEGLVGKFTARERSGKVIIQTRSEQNLTSWLKIDRN